MLADGNQMLQPRGYTVKPVARVHNMSFGRCVVRFGNHAIVLRYQAEVGFWTVDGKARRRMDTKELDSMSKEA